jgi:hypothetical protein
LLDADGKPQKADLFDITVEGAGKNKIACKTGEDTDEEGEEISGNNPDEGQQDEGQQDEGRKKLLWLDRCGCCGR